MVNFNVGYYDEYGNLIDSLRATRRYYLRRWDGFSLDAVSIIPLELLSLVVHDTMLIHYLMLIHMLRIIHIKRYLKSLQSKINVKYSVFTYVNFWTRKAGPKTLL